jgi:hypothetical protein
MCMHNRYSVTISLCAVLLFAFAVETAAQQPSVPSTQPELIDVQKAFVDAQERGDADYVKNALTDDFTQIETNGDSSGKKEFIKDIHPEEHPGPPPILYDFKIVELDEGCAVVTYNAVFASNQLERYQHLSDTWVKRDGKWQLKFQQSTLNLWSAHDLD